MDANTAFGVLAGVAGAVDVVTVYLRGAAMSPKMKALRLFGATLMLALSAAILLRLIKLG